MSTGSHLKVQRLGDAVMGVRLGGDRRRPEPEHFRVIFPGGDVDVVRTTDDDYWVHVRINHPHDGGDPDRVMAKLADARLDAVGEHAADMRIGDFDHPELYHLAVRISCRDR